jgi:hypothetical protein
MERANKAPPMKVKPREESAAAKKNKQGGEGAL